MGCVGENKFQSPDDICLVDVAASSRSTPPVIIKKKKKTKSVIIPFGYLPILKYKASSRAQRARSGSITLA